MAELIEMPFWLWTQVGQRNHVLDESSVPPTQRGNFQGKGASHCKVQGLYAECCESREWPQLLWPATCNFVEQLCAASLEASGLMEPED